MTKQGTPFGVIRYGGPCKDDYASLQIYDQDPPGSHPIRLQGPAMRSFKRAEVDYAERCGWSKARIRRNGGRPILLTGSWRSCLQQSLLHQENPDRYADPDTSLHPRGLAIDVSTTQTNLDYIANALRTEHWVRVRPDDEPWHWSYVVLG